MMIRVLSIGLAVLLLASPAFAALGARDELQAPRSHGEQPQAPVSPDELQAPARQDEIQAPRSAGAV